MKGLKYWIKKRLQLLRGMAEHPDFESEHEEILIRVDETELFLSLINLIDHFQDESGKLYEPTRLAKMKTENLIVRVRRNGLGAWDGE